MLLVDEFSCNRFGGTSEQLSFNLATMEEMTKFYLPPVSTGILATVVPRAHVRAQRAQLSGNTPLSDGQEIVEAHPAMPKRVCLAVLHSDQHQSVVLTVILVHVPLSPQLPLPKVS